MFTGKRWVCPACKKRFESKNEGEKHIATCSKVKEIQEKKNIKLREEKNKKREVGEAELKRQEERLKRQEEREEFQELLGKDKLANPHLSLISAYLYNNNNILHTTNEHLWWVALGVKIGLIMMAIFMFIILLFVAG